MTTAPAGWDFDTRTRPYRRALHVHCYRMLASYDDAEDAVQETYLRAWRGRASFEGEHLRAWLYRIATNACLDQLRVRRRRAGSGPAPAEIAWLTPYPDPLLDEIASSADEPDTVAVTRETIELAFLAALQVLPGRQRAALVGRDVLGLTAAETASMLGTTVAAANSAVQRARETMRRHLPSHRGDWTARAPNPDERRLLSVFIDAHEGLDAAGALAVAATDLRVTMPPQPLCFDGVDQVKPLLERAFGPERVGDWRLLPTSLNRMPAAASYLRRPGEALFGPFKTDVLRVEGGRIAEITTFGHRWFPALGLPAVLGVA